jgi:hypothetical protein
MEVSRMLAELDRLGNLQKMSAVDEELNEGVARFLVEMSSTVGALD